MQLLSAAQRTFFAQAAMRYQQDLAADTAAQAYLAGRGLGAEAAATFRLGVVRNPLVGHDQFRGRLAIPYLTVPTATGRGGHVVNFTFRCIQPHSCGDVGCVKYLAPEGMDRNMYHVTGSRTPGRKIVVAEGEIDTMSWALAGVPAIGIPGVDSWKPHFAHLLADYQEVYTAADGDKAGRKLAGFLAREVRARPLRFPDGDDSNSIFVREGPASLLALINRDEEEGES